MIVCPDSIEDTFVSVTEAELEYVKARLADIFMEKGQYAPELSSFQWFIGKVNVANINYWRGPWVNPSCIPTTESEK